MKTIPDEWLPDVRMEAIVLHWTAGSYACSELDKEHYHFIIEGNGNLVVGDHSIADNVNVADHDYAAHTRSFNTRVIGVSMCAMADAIERPFNPGSFPLTRKQWEKAAYVLADLSERYRIPVDKEHILSHAEVQPNLGIRQRGKWDIAILPFDRTFNTPRECGDEMRRMIRAIKDGHAVTAPDNTPSQHRVVAGDTLWAIARKYATTVPLLMQANPHIPPSGLINIDEVLELPDDR